MNVILFPTRSYSEIRQVECLYRAKLALRLGINAADVCTIFDMEPGAVARLAGEVAAR